MKGKPKHVAIADALESDIGSGRLGAGARLPTHRALADHLGVSLGTVTRAFGTAERRGLVRGETGRGTFVAGGQAAHFGRAGTGASSVIDLSRTWPLYSQDPDLAPALRSIARSPARAELLQYQHNAGMQQHREAGAAWASRFGVSADANAVLVCGGVQHALTVILSTVAEPGDWLFTEELTYPGLKALAQLLHLRIAGLPMDADGLIPEAFEKACRTRKAKALYCTPTLHNPTTSTLPLRRRERIAKIARANGLAIIEDDVHRLLADDPPTPLANLAPERTYFIAGMSKAVSGALRVAYLISPPTTTERLSQALWATSWMAPPLTAEVAARWIEDGTADATVKRKRREALARIDLARKVLPMKSLRAVPSAYHAWLELPEPWTGAAFASAAYARGVAVTPLETFAANTNGAAPAVRLCLSAPWDRDTLRDALERVAAVLREPPGMARPVV